MARATRPCIERGCPQPAITKGRCIKHRRNGSTREWRKTRERILERDGHRCTVMENGQRCMVTASLEIHHVNGDHRDNRDENLTTVCKLHHDQLPRGLNR